MARMGGLKIEILDCLILMIKSWHDDTYVGCDGACKHMKMINSLSLESIIIEENSKNIRNKASVNKTLI
jgi:hypothetical protein